MPFYYLARDICKLRKEFLQSVIGVLNRKLVDRELTGFTTRDRIYNSWVVVVMFLSQVVARDSCRQVVAAAINRRLIPSGCCEGDSAYCNRRNKLPEVKIKKLAFEVGKRLSKKSRKAEMFFGRRVKVVDGTSVQLPDTSQNQSEYPQPTAQKEGCGTPVMYVSALMDLATGAMLWAETIGRSGHEQKLFRMLWKRIRREEIVLGDSIYCSFGLIVGMTRRSIDCVIRWNNARKHRPKTKRLGYNDWLELWERPIKPEPWVWFELPETITVRVIRFECSVPGFRSKTIELVTTLLDSKRYPKKELMRLYARRWEMELRFDDIKTTMHLARLSCRTPKRCRNELWMGLMAYNLIRTVMLHAARTYSLDVKKISFAGTRDRLVELGSGLLSADDPKGAYDLLLKHVAHDVLPDRPNRYEPRCVKRRWTKHRLLTVPREVARNALLAS
jgi:hypothetical protein